MKIVSIVLVAGNSTRFESKVSKQMFLLNNKEVFSYSLDAFEENTRISAICVVTTEELKPWIEQYIAKQNYKNAFVVVGGQTRQESVENGLNAFKDLSNEDIVIIHDGARPLLDQEIIENIINETIVSGASTTYLPVEDTIAVTKGKMIEKFVDRTKLIKIQTPQAFKFDIIIKAHRLANNNEATDDCSLVKKLPHEISLVLGSKKLTKITTIEDIKYLENLLK